MPSFEIDSGSLVPGTVPPGLKERPKAHVLFGEKIGVLCFYTSSRI